MLQCILLGQPPLRDALAHSALQQRVIATHHLEPLLPEETRGYILHRLRYVGWRGDPGFSGEAIGLIHGCSHGIPRRINALCDRLLLFGCLEERHEIDAAAVTSVHAEWVTEAGLEAGAADAATNGVVNLGALGREQAVIQVSPRPAPSPVHEAMTKPPAPSSSVPPVMHSVAVADASVPPAPLPVAPRRLIAAQSLVRP